MSLAHLLGILRESLILVPELTFYADESGIHDPHGEQPGSEVASIAGYIATKDQWLTLERRWNTALKKFKVPVFHMSECNKEEKYLKPDSPYLGWSDAKKKRFLRALINIASKVPLAGYGSMVETKAWDTILDNETKIGVPRKTKRGQIVEDYNPYVNVFQNFFAKFPKFLDQAVNPLLSEHNPVSKVAFVFDQHKQFGEAALRGFRLSKEILRDDRLGSFVLSDDKCAPLQAADLLAFYSRRRFARFLRNVPADEFELRLLDPDPENPDKVYLIHLSRENLDDLQKNSEKQRALRSGEL